MSIGIKDLVDQINSEISSPANDSLRVSQLAGSTTFNTYSVATVDALPLASENTGRFILVLSSDSYYFSDGTKWTNKVESTIGGIIAPWIWGCNNIGQLGDGTTINKSSPIAFEYENLGWTDISLSYQGIAIRGDGTAWTWGSGQGGALGNNATIDKCSPVSVVGGFTDWCDISAGSNSIVAIRKNGTGWSWGINTNGQLGDNTVVSKSSPVAIVGGFTDWCKMSGGTNSAVGLRKNGSIWSWGVNSVGQLGDGTTVNKSSPISIVGGFVDWCNISTGVNHVLSIRTNGTLWSWGGNANGRLGDGTTISKSSPVSVIGGFTDWWKISAGQGHSLAIRQDGTAWTWGLNASGQLGDGTAVSNASPVSVIGGFTDWCDINGGLCTSAGIRTDGTAWTWGSNTFGKLGDGTTVNKSSPVSVVGGFTDWHTAHQGIAQTAMLRYTPKGF